MGNCKIIYLLTLSTMLLFPAVLWGQNSPFVFSSALLERAGDSLTLQMEIQMPPKTVYNHQEWRVQPVLSAGSSIREFPALVVQGKKRAKLSRRGRSSYLSSSVSEVRAVSFKEEAFLFYQVTVPYEEWMREAELLVNGVLTACAGRRDETLLGVVTPLKTGWESAVIEEFTTTIHVNYIEPSRHRKERSTGGSAYLTFETGKTRLLPDFENNRGELDKIDTLLDKIRQSGDLFLTEVGIQGYASPEGTYPRNQYLSEKRAAALTDYLSERHAFSSSLLHSSGLGEDWQGLRALVEEGNLRDKAKILSIIDSPSAWDQKEMELSRLGTTWYILLYDYFPRLRRVKYEIGYDIRAFEKEEVEHFFLLDPSSLSVAELFMMAENYPPDSEEWHSLIAITLLIYPDDPVALINAAASALVRGEIEQAAAYLSEVKDDPRSYNNQGAYYLLLKDTEKAEWYLKRANGVSGVESNLLELEKLRLEPKTWVKGLK